MLHDERAGPLCPRQKEFLSDILTSAQHLLHVVNETLDFAKHEAGKMDFAPTSCDVAQVIREVRHLTRWQLSQKQLNVHIELDPDLGIVATDPLRLKQVLLNYLTNAIKFTPERGSITLRSRLQGARAFRVEVEDSGPGIAATEIGKLFVAFQQLDVSNRGHGTGLGLALTKHMVEAQGGQVGVSSRPGGGSVFYAVLPSSTLPLAEPTREVRTES